MLKDINSLSDLSSDEPKAEPYILYGHANDDIRRIYHVARSNGSNPLDTSQFPTYFQVYDLYYLNICRLLSKYILL